MSLERKFIRIQERRFSAHHMLIRAAQLSSARATEKNPGSLYDELAAMTFAALAIEALCNSIGDRVFEDWQASHERSSPRAKLRLLASKLKVPFDKEAEPWKGASELLTFRNDIAHAKPVLVTEKTELTEDELDKRLFDIPLSNLERRVSVEAAERAVRTVEEIKDLFISSLEPDQAFSLRADAWHGSTHLVDKE